MNYLARHKAEFSEKRLPGELTKPPEAPSVSSVSTSGRHLLENNPGSGNVVRLLLHFEDGTEATLAIPKDRYNGVHVLEMFELHRMAGTTRVIAIRQADERATANT
jgi:hypothetical protein